MQSGIFILILCVVIAIALSVKPHERFNRYITAPYPNMCEFNEECMWDTARTVQLSNGMEGVCTLHGIACPSFSKDNSAARTAGVSPTMVDANYYASTLKQNPFIGSDRNSALSNTWGVNPPVINHYHRHNAPLLYNHSFNEFFDGNTAISLGLYPVEAG